MDAELMTIFQNINSLVEQAKQMLGGGGGGKTTAGEPGEEEGGSEMAEKIMKFLKEMDEPENETEEEKEGNDTGEVAKAEQPKLSTPDEGVTATDNAGEIIDEKSEAQEKNLNEIARSIVKMMSNKKVQKSVEKHNELKAIKEEQAELRKALENVFEGLGIANQIKTEVKKSEENRRIDSNPNEIKKSIDFIRHELGLPVKDNRPIGNSNESVHKSLSDALEAMTRR
jgi:hypothetical protein